MFEDDDAASEVNDVRARTSSVVSGNDENFKGAWESPAFEKGKKPGLPHMAYDLNDDDDEDDEDDNATTAYASSVATEESYASYKNPPNARERREMVSLALPAPSLIKIYTMT